jgi:Coenzyme PQQ synthesis protein D (PqqD)
MALSPAIIVSRSTRIAQRLFEERMLVISAQDSKLHRFNEVGTFIWQLLEKPATVGAICAAIEEHFDGFDAGKSFQEISDFLVSLEKKKCVSICPQKQ